MTSPTTPTPNLKPAEIDPALLDDEGYLVDPDAWTDEMAAPLARVQGITLQDEHWQVIRFMREHYLEHRVCADARHAMKLLDQHHPGQGRKRLFELFPYGYVAQACRIAGMRRPRTWSTG
jgi:TusE/DsrC/DsvC family sulfur relay protein